MEWFELSIATTHQACEAIGGVLLLCGVNCWAVEDKADLTDFMQHNRELWDYVDDSLRTTEEAVAQALAEIRDSRSKFRALVNPQARNNSAIIEDV